MSLLTHTRHILLADDDNDDTELFREIMEALPHPARLTVVHNGEQLMQFISGNANQLPDTLFLDMNMPRKNGFECLGELKCNEQLKAIPVIIFTTSNEPSVISRLYNAGAQYYIRKPNTVEELKKLILLALTLTEQANTLQPPEEKFVLSSQSFNDENKQNTTASYPQQYAGSRYGD